MPTSAAGSEFGRGALHLAAELGRTELAECLLKGEGGAWVSGTVSRSPRPRVADRVCAEVNLRTPFGLTAAHYAAANGHVAMLRLLAQSGADLGARSDFQATPLDLARAHGQAEAENFLHLLRAPMAGPIWRPNRNFMKALCDWQQQWGERVGSRGRGRRDDFLCAMFEVLHEELIWPVTPEMGQELIAFRRRWREHASRAANFNLRAHPLTCRQGRLEHRWPLSPELSHELEDLHRRWQQQALAAVLGVPAWWVTDICDPLLAQMQAGPSARRNDDGYRS